MAIDPYDICPCGSGKKVKFCRCADSLNEYEKVRKMFDGDQVVAALDRVNKLIADHPNTAWLMAMKCEILLHLREYNGLTEAAARFQRLKPDNPVAMFYQAMVMLSQKKIPEAAKLFYDGLAGSREHVDPLAMSVAASLILVTQKMGDFLTASSICAIVDTHVSDEYGQKFRESLLSNREISTLEKFAPAVISPGEVSPANDRLFEAHALAGSMYFEKASTKLKSILREFPTDASSLTLLFLCQVLLLDNAAAAETAQKIANLSDLPWGLRVTFQAYVLTLSEPKKAFGVVGVDSKAKINDLDQVRAKLAECKYLLELDNEATRRNASMLFGVEVPPQNVYTLWDKAHADQNEATNEDDLVPRLLGMVAVFGRQTDSEPLIAFVSYDTPSANIANEAVKNAVADLTYDWETNSTIVMASRYFNRMFAPMKNEGALPTEKTLYNSLLSDLNEVALPVLGGQTTAQAVADPSNQIRAAGLLYFLQCIEFLPLSRQDYRKLHDKFSLPIADINPTQLFQDADQSTSEMYELYTLYAMTWVDYAKIEDTQRLGIGFFALQFRAKSLMSDLVESLQHVDHSDASVKLQTQQLVLQLKLQSVVDASAIPEILKELIELTRQVGSPVGELVMQRVSILESLGRAEEAEAYFMQCLTEYSDDPEMREIFEALVAQQARQQATRQRPFEVTDRLATRGAKGRSSGGSDSGLWVPGQTATASSDTPAEEGGSKLWLPGME